MRIAKGVGMRDENTGGGWGGGASCTEVRACTVFAACDCVVSSLLRSSLRLTSPKSSTPLISSENLLSRAAQVYTWNSLKPLSSDKCVSQTLHRVEGEN